MKQSSSWRRYAIAAAMALALLPATGKTWAAEPESSVQEGLNAYLLDNCPISGQKLGAMGEAIVKEYKGRKIRFCCQACVKPFEADLEKNLAKVDAALIQQQTPLYDVDTCIISGGKLDSMGGPVDHLHGNRLIRFCCKGCIEPFEKDAAKHLAKLDAAAIEKQKPAYPTDQCVVSGSKLGSMGEPIDYVLGNRLIRLCCKGCIAQVNKDPAKYLKGLDAAAAGKESKNATGSGSASKDSES